MANGLNRVLKNIDDYHRKWKDMSQDDKDEAIYMVLQETSQQLKTLTDDVSTLKGCIDERKLTKKEKIFIGAVGILALIAGMDTVCAWLLEGHIINTFLGG